MKDLAGLLVNGFDAESPAVVKEISKMHRIDAGVLVLLMHRLNAEEIAKFKQLLKPIKDQLSLTGISFVV